MAMQLSLQSCTMEMRDTVVMSLKTWADCALFEIFLENVKVARKSVFMTLLLAT